MLALQRALARGEVGPEIDIELAMHGIQGPLISQRIVANNDVSSTDLDRLLDMTMRALGAVAAGADHGGNRAAAQPPA